MQSPSPLCLFRCFYPLPPSPGVVLVLPPAPPPSPRCVLGVRLTLMPPSGSNSERTMGLVPSARLLATLSMGSSWGVVKNAFRPAGGAGVDKILSRSPAHQAHNTLHSTT